MKYILLIISISFCCSVQAQQQTANSPLLFSSHFYDMENHWVAFPKNEKTGKYPFGFIYMDAMAGFTFSMEGSFGLDAQGKVFRDSTDYLKKTASYRYRLAPNTKLVYAIPDGMLASLGVKQVPDWLSVYKVDMNSVSAKVSWGKNYNSAGQPQKALEYLEAAYKTDPHAAGLEFELSYSYNELKQYNKAIAVLNAAVQNKPDNVMFYRELGYSYMNKNDADDAVKIYLKGIDLAGQRNADAKAEMAWNLAVIYRNQKNDAEYKKWGQNAKDWAPAGSELARSLSKVIFQ